MARVQDGERPTLLVEKFTIRAATVAVRRLEAGASAMGQIQARITQRFVDPDAREGFRRHRVRSGGKA